MYFAVATRRDIMFSVSYLSTLNDCYREEHFKCAKRLRYLKGTKSMGIHYKKTVKMLIGMADTDWAASKDDGRSFSGYVFKYTGAAISWASKKQQSAALSTADAKYSITEATRGNSIHLLHKNLKLQQEKPVIIFCD